jgi:YHS domain-containing protein
MDDTDPVCGREVETDAAPAQSNFEGDVYTFCSTECRQEFEQAPERYVATRVPR